MTITITAFERSPDGGKGLSRDTRVRRSGYRNVATIECRGSTYTFEATRKGRDVIVYADSRNGAIWRR